MILNKFHFCLVFLLFSSSLHAQKIMGFSDENAVKQADWEKQYDAQLNAKDLDSWMQYLTSHPHHVGSIQDKANAEYIDELFKQWGYQTQIDSYTVLFPSPKTRILELLGANPFK